MSDESLARITALLPLRPSGDPVALADWYVAGQDHQPCRPGAGCPACFDTMTGIVGGAEPDPDPIEREARDLLELWYGQGSTRIETRFPGLPSRPDRSRLGRYL